MGSTAAAHSTGQPAGMDSLVALASASLGPLLRAYWILAAGSVIVTLLPVPLLQAFKCVVRCGRWVVGLLCASGSSWQGAYMQ